MSLDLYAIPNPPNSPIEKLLDELMWENVEPRIRATLSENPSREELLRAFSYYDQVMAEYVRRHERYLTYWANTHTHDGLAGADPTFGISGDAWTDMGATGHTSSAEAMNMAALDGVVYLAKETNGVFRRYDVASETWDAAESLASSTANFPPSALGAFGEYIYLAGHGLSSGALMRRYDPDTDTWTSLATPPGSLTSRKGVVGGNGKVVMFSDTTTPSGRTYDIDTDSWASTAPCPFTFSTAGFRCEFLEGDFYLFGQTGKTLIYNYEADSWAEDGIPISGARISFATGVVSQRLYAVQGATESDPLVNTDLNDEFNPVSNTWGPRAPSPFTTRNHAAVGLAPYLYVAAANGADLWRFGGTE